MIGDNIPEYSGRAEYVGPTVLHQVGLATIIVPVRGLSLSTRSILTTPRSSPN